MLTIDVNLLDNLAKTVKAYPSLAVDIVHGIKANQLLSKQEIVCHVPVNQSVVILGGWYSVGFSFLGLHKQNKFCSVDINPRCELIGRSLHLNIPNINFITADALRFDTSPYQVVINSSTEHMDTDQLQFSFANIESNKLCIFQNNNMFFVDDHINCFKTCLDFQKYLEEQFNIESITETQLDNQYVRYTAVCRKI
jgi:hypothetical protein